mgnify:CR=1 FL=1
MEVDYYELFGVDPDATTAEIRRAYRRMAEVYHPDKLRELPPSTRMEGEEIMRLMNEAKSVLFNREKRESYDTKMGYKEPEAQKAVVLQEVPLEMGYVQVELDRNEKRVKSKMSRVLSAMKDAFSRDRDFQIKIEEAQEMVEARVIDDSEDVDFVIEDNKEDVEMTATFKVLDRWHPKEVYNRSEVPSIKDKRYSRMEPKHMNEKSESISNGFRIVAIEGDEDEEGVEIDWEE